MLKRSFDLNLKAFVSPALFESRLKRSQSEKRYYYLPNIEGTSHILAYQDVAIASFSFKLSGITCHSNSKLTILDSSTP